MSVSGESITVIADSECYVFHMRFLKLLLILLPGGVQTSCASSPSRCWHSFKTLQPHFISSYKKCKD
jgi:hypothetical protein